MLPLLKSILFFGFALLMMSASAQDVFESAGQTNYETDFVPILTDDYLWDEESDYEGGSLSEPFDADWVPEWDDSYLDDDYFVAVAAPSIDDWREESFATIMGNIYPTEGPTPDIFLPEFDDFHIRRKRGGKYGLNYEIPLDCKREKSGTEKRVTNG